MTRLQLLEKVKTRRKEVEYRLDEKSLMGTQKRGAGEAKKNQISTNMHKK